MNKTWLILKNEVYATVMRRSFWLTVIGVPLISTFVFAGIAALIRKQSSQAAVAIEQVFSSAPARSPIPEGYVDSSGLIKTLPASIPPSALRALPDEASAKRALRAGEISAYYVIPPDYLRDGQLIYVRPDFNPLSAFEQAGWIQWALKVNLLGGDERLASRVNSPMNLQEVSQAPATQHDENNPLTFFLPYAVMMTFYIIIITSASIMLSSITKEKENRVLEILMMSTNPQQLLSGKIVALGFVGLFQTVLWVGTGYILLRLGGSTFSLPANFQLPPSFLAWALVFFILGYAIYASLMASVGALVPNLREASQATFIVILPLIIPLMMISVMIEDPNGALATGLSLFPLTAPVVMMTRLAATVVPLWQILLSVVLMALTVAYILRAVASMFQAQILLSGQPFNVRRFFNALAGNRMNL